MILPRYSHHAPIDYHPPFLATNLHCGSTTISWCTQRNIQHNIANTILPMSPRMITDKINWDVTGVVDVKVAWSGAELHKWLGEQIVMCMVTRLAKSIGDDSDDTEQQQQGDHRDEGRKSAPTKESTIDSHGCNMVTQCFEVSFTI